MLFHLWLFTVQSHKRLHSVTLFSSRTGHPYFRAVSSENIDGLRYYGFVCSKPMTPWYLQFNFKSTKLRTRTGDNVYMSCFSNDSLCQRADLDVSYIQNINRQQGALQESGKYHRFAPPQYVVLMSYVAANCTNIDAAQCAGRLLQ